MEVKHTPGPWEWADVPGAGLQIRGPYKDSTRLLFSDIWRQFPNREWDETMVANARLAAAAPELLYALQFVMSAHGEQLSTAFEMAHNAINKATGSES